jgi:exodeoxyribonuclease V gamma subunit
VRAPFPSLDVDLELSALQRFFRRPQEIFLKERLKLYLPRELAELADREPIELDALDRFRLADELLEQREPLSRADRARLLHKAGRLGPGSVGKAQFEELEELVDGVLSACPSGEALPDRQLRLTLPSGRLTGRIGCLQRDGHVVRSVGTLHVKRLMSAFIEHLALCASGSEPRRTLVIGRERKREIVRVAFSAVDDAAERLDALLRLYRIGMCMPLPLFHEASECYARERHKGAEPRAALARAQAKIALSRGQMAGVADDPHVLQLFSREQLLDLGALAASDGAEQLDFGAIAELVFAPMLRHMEVSE